MGNSDFKKRRRGDRRRCASCGKPTPQDQGRFRGPRGNVNFFCAGCARVDAPSLTETLEQSLELVDTLLQGEAAELHDCDLEVLGENLRKLLDVRDDDDPPALRIAG